MPEEAMMVSLSRPFVARIPKITPKATPGLTLGGTSAPQDRTIFIVEISNAPASTPMVAAGTKPKSDNTE